MNLIDTYISEIGRRLPAKNRSDIEQEIRSTLEDMLEERRRKAGGGTEEELVVSLLQDFGAPGKVAASYQGERYLIGPTLFPIFMSVIRIVPLIIGGLALLGYGIRLVESGPTLENVLQGVAGIFSSLITVLGNVVLIFAIIEWVLHREGGRIAAKKEKEWDPRTLLRISPPDRAKRGEHIFNIIFDFAVIVVFNFYPQWIGFNTYEAGTWVHSPIFSDAFFAFIPWLTLAWALDITLNILVLQRGVWSNATRWADIALRAAMITAFGFMLGTPGILSISTSPLVSAGPLSGQAAQLVETAARQGGASILVIVMLFEALEIIRHLRRMMAANKRF